MSGGFSSVFRARSPRGAFCAKRSQARSCTRKATCPSTRTSANRPLRAARSGESTSARRANLGTPLNRVFLNTTRGSYPFDPAAPAISPRRSALGGSWASSRKTGKASNTPAPNVENSPSTRISNKFEERERNLCFFLYLVGVNVHQNLNGI